MGDRGQGGPTRRRLAPLRGPGPARRRLVGLCALAVAVAFGAAPAAAAERDEPVVLTGSSVGPLNGVAPGDLVGFRFDPATGGWTQIPVQVDQRKFVDFGEYPASNSTPGTEGTVYGGPPIGHGAFQYADPRTWVGPDPDPALDGDDEVSLMSGDAGERAPLATRLPGGVDAAAATEVRIADPLGGATRFAYLFRSIAGLDPAAGRDYVDYQFRLDSGDYRSTYRRAGGPNPETSRISTADYSAGFSDRWYLDRLAIEAGGAAGPDISDGFKFSFGPTDCGRSEATFNAGEGAFAANLDGPVRAIRAYVGANSGPLTERTNVFYRDRYTIVTDLRVHPVPGPLTYHDLSSAAIGMTYLNSANRAGVPVDGSPDTIDTSPVSWSAWTGAQGTLVSTDRIESSFAAALLAAASTWYLDDSTPAPYLQCWGDTEAIGQAGMRSTYSMPNTDPRNGGSVATLHSTTTDIVAAPGISAAGADLAAERIDNPLAADAAPWAARVAPEPQTRIVKRPPNRLRSPRARYRFSANLAGAGFECRLDRRAWRRCRSHKTFTHLDRGRHRVRVRAVAPDGTADPSAARDRFRVVG